MAKSLFWRTGLMYQALYRKYRSQNFNQLVGQEVIAKTLMQAVANHKVSHAYLFSGPRGTGKTSVAKIFAKAMNCPNQKDGEPCNNCSICHDITNGSLDDVIEIDAASNNGVDEIRDIRDKSTYAPSQATYKVYIIDEVHMLSTGAFNALLKTLEEPTENVVFILATTEIHKIPATILSRVQRFEFKSIKQEQIKTHLIAILEKERVSFDEEAIQLIARCAEGGMRDALSILDQALSLVDNDILSLEIAEEITGSISQNELDNYLKNIISKDAHSAIQNLEAIFNSGKSMSRFASDLLLYLRDILILQNGGNNERQSPIFLENATYSQELIFKMIDLITQNLPELKNGLQPKLYAEMLTIQLTQLNEQHFSDIPENFIQSFKRLEQEVEQLKKQLTNNDNHSQSLKQIPKKQYSYKVDKPKILKIMNETVQNSQQSKQYLDALKNAWNEILDSLSAQDRALLNGSEPVLANQENAILAFTASFNAEQAMNRTDLNHIFSNIMSQVANFSPNILAISKSDFQELKLEFSQNLKKNKNMNEESRDSAIPENFSFLSEKLKISDD